MQFSTLAHSRVGAVLAGAALLVTAGGVGGALAVGPALNAAVDRVRIVDAAAGQQQQEQVPHQRTPQLNAPPP